MTIEAINPATGERVAVYEETSPEEVDRALDEARGAFEAWRRVPVTERVRPLSNAAAILEERSSEWARLIAREMGKPVSQGRAETEKCAWVCRYYAEHAADFLAQRPVETDASESFVAFRPLGVVLAVMPWNFPFWQVFRFAAPGLAAGNAAVLKHASNVPGCALAVESILREAGFPEGLFRTLLIGSDRAGEVIDDPRVAAITLTGSVGAGRAVAERAGRNLEKTVLELGGSDPYVVLEDADLEQTAEACAASRLVNSGQSCVAAKRFVAVEAILEPFTDRLVERMGRAKMGDPMDESTGVGPQARRDLRDELHRQVEVSVAAGAELLLGGAIPDGPGAFYPPTVLAAVGPGMPAYEEELFGPVAAIIPAADEADAIRIANDSRFGLGAAVFTADEARGRRIATEELEAGCCFVNDFVRSDPRLPFGGVKESGYGRELSEFGIREFVNVKTVWVR